MENCSCFVCLKPSVNVATSILELEDEQDKVESGFWKFVKNYLHVNISSLEFDKEKVKHSICDNCIPLINSICQLYLELLGIQLRLSWKVGELGSLLNRSVQKTSLNSENHLDQVRKKLAAECAKRAQEFLADAPLVQTKIKMMMKEAGPIDCSLFRRNKEDTDGGEEAYSNEWYPFPSEEGEEKISVPIANEQSSTSATDSEKKIKENHSISTVKVMGEMKPMNMKTTNTNLEAIPSKKDEEIPNLPKERCWWTCKLCGVTSAGKFQEHLQSHENALPPHKKPLHCPFCYRTFAFSQSLQHHVVSWHSRFSKMLTKEGLLLCQEEGCLDVDPPVKFERVSELNQHLKTHLNENEVDVDGGLHLCSACGLGFIDKNLLKLHELLHIRPKMTPKGRRVACPVCGKQCNDSVCLQNHYNIFHGAFLKTHKCSECPTVCTSAKGVLNHWKRFHSGAEKPPKLQKDPVFCLECGKELKNKLRLEQHIGRVHKQVDCDVCGESFIGLDARKEHRIKVHKFRDCCGNFEGEEYNCSICNKKFSSRLQLQKHMSYLHSGKIFSCSTCRKVFRRKGEMKKHEKKVHGEMASDENTKSHLCPQCGKVYSNPVSLAAHLAVVHKEANELEEGGRAGGGGKRKVHECPHCEEKFGWKYVLDRHLLKAHPGLQIGEGMLECNICGLRMTSGHKSKMDYHKSTHLTMEERRREGKLHMCHHCGKEFRTRWSYKGHIKMHENKSQSGREGENSAADNSSPAN